MISYIELTLNRLLGEDTEGLLYIGMTKGTLLNRVSNLQKALFFNSKFELPEPISSGHTQMGMKYFRIRKSVKIDDLYVKIFPNKNPTQEESLRLDNYVKEYGELPPLNGQYGSCFPKWSEF